MKIELEPCQSPIWANTGHLQTLWGHFLKSPTLKLPNQTISIRLPDEDQLVGYYLPGQMDRVVYLFHGLGGSIHSAYITRSARVAQSLGYHVIMMNHRGCGEGAGLAKKTYHSGRSEDLSAVIDFGRQKFPSFQHIAIGFSLSANALLLLLSQVKGGVLPDVAMTVNAPMNLLQCSLALRKGFNKVYDYRFVLDFERELKTRAIANPDLKVYQQKKYLSVYDIDQAYTAPISGFFSREHYYETCSTHDKVGFIKTPTFVLTAKDDPFVVYEAYQKALFSKQMQVHVEDKGGHLGYVTDQKLPYGHKRWLDYAVHEFLKYNQETT